MADKRGEGASPDTTTPPRATKAIGSIVALVAGMGTRKLVTVGWKRITGKEPPSDPHDLHVGIGEALSWVIVLGVTMETARLLAQRAVVRRVRRRDTA
jgi:uncharacterized protein DUF4235